MMRMFCSRGLDELGRFGYYFGCRESVARSMKVMEHEWVVEIRIVEAVAEEGRRGMTFPVVEPVTVPA